MNNIKIDTWKKADRIYKELSNSFSVQPTRIKNSVEDGVALIYGKKFGPFYKEFFIEIYNDLSVSYVATKNYKTLFEPNEQTVYKSDNEYIFNLKKDFKKYFID